VAACLASVVVLVRLTSFNFMPQDDSSEFEVAFQAPEGSTLERTTALAEEIQRRLKEISGSTTSRW